MPKYLFIAEKPSLARDIKTAYKSLKSPGFDAEIVNLVGHLMELQEPEDYTSEWGKPYRKEVLPMIPNEFIYRPKIQTLPTYNSVKNLLLTGGFDAVVNACDAGREGEAIFWTLYNHAGATLPAKRLWASDTTVETIAKALQNLFDYAPNNAFSNLRDASLCRMEFDWLVGMNLSRAAMLSTGKAISVGRVKSPTQNIVVTRDLEIANFKAKDFFEVTADFDGYKGGWFKGKQTSFDTENEAKAMVSKLGKQGTVKSVDEEKSTLFAPALYSLTDLQKDANIAYGFTAAETLNIAQSLYETHKILSYPRTEAKVLSTAMGKEIPDLLKAIEDVPEVSASVKMILADPSRISKVCANKKYVDNKKLTDHHALVNTKSVPNLAKLSDKERKVFMLVIKRFVSIFLDPQIVSKTTVVTEIDGESFKTVGSVILQAGYTEILKDSSKTDENVIPKVSVGDVRSVKSIKVNGKKTQPPKPYTDASLLDAMKHAGKFVEEDAMKEILDDSKGIGTTATRADIIDGLINKNFLYRKGKTIRATDFGIETIKALDGKDIISPILTAKWEEKLRSIEDGDMTDTEFRATMKDFITEETESFLTTLTSMKNVRKVVGKCPLCGSDVVEGKNYYMCSHYKQDEEPCEFICSKTMGGQDITADEMAVLLSGGKTKQKKFKNKDGKSFTASLTLEDQTFEGKTFKRVAYVFSTGEVIGKCPKCGGDIIDRAGAYGCENETCDFFITKTLKGATITPADVKNLISGKETATKKFFSGKKPWFAKLKYSDNYTKLNFDFQTKSDK